MKIARISLILLVAIFGMTACRTKPLPPEPSSTAFPSGSGSTNPGLNTGGWNNPTPDGLESRGAGFAMGEGERQEGLLPSVYFDFDQSVVRPIDRTALQTAANFLIENPDARLIIEAFCDWRGTTEYNLALGNQRAASVKDYLVNLGISIERIETVSFGDQQAATEATEDEMQEDRRADLVVIR